MATRIIRILRLPAGWRVTLSVNEPRPSVARVLFELLVDGLLLTLQGIFEALRWCGIAALVVAMLLAVCHTVFAAPAIPAQAAQHRATLIREARAQWGINAPSATFGAQIQQESNWNPSDVSPVGAQGLAQFMPATARWLPSVAPDTGEPLPFNPGWAIRALVTYDRWLWQRIHAATNCDRMAMTLSAYNGGLGWLNRDTRLAAAQGRDPALWWDHVETVNAGRSSASIRENRHYPRRILRTLEPVYTAAGWGGGMCRD